MYATSRSVFFLSTGQEKNHMVTYLENTVFVKQLLAKTNNGCKKLQKAIMTINLVKKNTNTWPYLFTNKLSNFKFKNMSLIHIQRLIDNFKKSSLSELKVILVINN